MALKLRVKLGDVSNLSDARYAAGMGVEAIGFDVSVNSALSSEQVSEITNWLSGVDIIGEIGDASSPAEGYLFDYLETTDREKLTQVNPGILRLDLQNTDLEEVERLVDRGTDGIHFLLLEIQNEDLDPLSTKLNALTQKVPLFISCHLEPEDLEGIIKKIAPAGIELKGGKEDKPGFKDYDELADILEALENE